MLTKCPYVVSLVGASWTRPSNLECVIEFMNLGDLRTYLTRNTPVEFSWTAKHASIKCVSRNVLLDSEKGTKITDFGESRELEKSRRLRTPTFQWMAPKVWTGHDYSTAADIYSLGAFPRK
ncbi:hypothetical protein ACHHYP_20734 [Achlya hypogyna]|uniref:Protein kinase domain-containing protein n=1 Tax=Achlya hypogyna TaxID=1202772 RepID=A0A1V9ZF56_ACHHY|nr:hypothetical protein ACHHYP_20734 [Achlya hypogyna]